jgi:[acyl-carrier-protein] S-malonyltransferase
MSSNSQFAVVFPGQGSQSLGMATSLIENHPETNTLFATASDILGYDLLEVITSGPIEKLNQTEITQPALLVSAYVTWSILKKNSNSIPKVLAGHSLGEYTALVCAGVISFEECIGLVAERGRCMQRTVPNHLGAMAAILGLDDEQVIQVCNENADNEIVSAANFNSPGQVVIAGHKSAVERTIIAAKDAGAKRAMILPVSVPSHCLLMQEAADQFAEVLNKITFKDANIPVIQNVDATAKSKAEEIKPALLEQLYKPVLWADSVVNLKKFDITKVIECGPGKVLSGLIKRIDRTLETCSTHDEAALLKAAE